MVLSTLGCKKKSVCGGKKNPYENKEIRVYLKSSEPGSRRLVTPPPRTAAKQPPPGTVDGAEDAGFSLHVRLRRCAAVRPEHALLSGEGLQQVQGGTGESEDAPLCCRSSGGFWRRFGRFACACKCNACVSSVVL